MFEKNRLFLFRIALIAGIVLVFGRVLQIQFYYGDRLRRWARSQEREIELKGPRGKIRDRQGRDLAFSVETFSFFADPAEIENVKSFSHKVSKLLQMPIGEVEAKLKTNKGRRFVWLKRQLDRKFRISFDQLKEQGLDGLGVLREYKREYPNGDLLSQVLGRVSIDGEGIEGVEREYDKNLQAGVSLVRTPRDARGRLFYTDKDQLLSKGDAGKDVYLTIDLHLQSLVETALDNFKKKYSSDSAMAIVVDPLTNEILVWAQNPRSTKNGAAFRNLAATDPIEPGSVVKPLLVSWGLERNFVHEKTIFDIPLAGVKIGDKVFKDEHQKKDKKLSPEEILKFSSNVGAIKIQQRIGFKDFWTMFEKVGFLERSGLQLSSESKGIVRKPRDVQTVEQATMAFGQGFAITPLQLTRAFTILAGDGHLRPLKFLKDDAKVVAPENYEKVLSDKTLARIRKLMESALTEGGTAVHARVEGYNVAGKTGTSQRSIGKKGYSETSYWTSFVGFLPSEDPKYLIYAAFDNPKIESNTGGKTAAPLFAEIARLCIRSDDPLAPNQAPTDESVTRELASTLQNSSQAAEPGVTEEALVAVDETTVPAADSTHIPNMTGLHLREAILSADKSDVVLKIKGRGHFVAHQYPLGGTPMMKKREVTLFLK